MEADSESRAPRRLEAFALWLLHLAVHAHGALCTALRALRAGIGLILALLIPRRVLASRWDQGAKQAHGWKAPPPSKIAVVVAEQQAVDTSKIASILGW